ncbi:hypothetical protein BDW69DRAFT_172967 [Aspergillus filifer]
MDHHITVEVTRRNVAQRRLPVIMSLSGVVNRRTAKITIGITNSRRRGLGVWPDRLTTRGRQGRPYLSTTLLFCGLWCWCRPTFGSGQQGALNCRTLFEILEQSTYRCLYRTAFCDDPVVESSRL